MKRASWTLPLLSLALCAFVPAFAAVPPSVTATFDDLLTPPALNSATGFVFANGGSSAYAGITWDSRFTVIGDQYRVDPAGGPLFGIRHSEHYYVGNANGDDGLLITTSQLLTGAWFGRNAFYGYSNDIGGADQITITAMSGSTDKLSVSFNLPALSNSGPVDRPNQPETMSFVDTGTFLSLTGITGYRINRQPSGIFGNTWVADDFNFVAAPVPEPETWATLVAGLVMVGWARRRFGR